jgi:Golgi phosphoprotein 3
MKIGYQLKQVRERLAKGLVDKGILRTEKRNFLLFDMATHPVADGGAKEEIRRRVRNVLTQRTVVLPASQFLPENLEFRYIRTIAMVCAAYAANVLENALATLGHEARERAFAQVDELLAEYSQWPFGKRAGGASGVGANLGQVISEEVNNGKDKELQLEVCFRVNFISRNINLHVIRSSQHVLVSSHDWTLCYRCWKGVRQPRKMMGKKTLLYCLNKRTIVP